MSNSSSSRPEFQVYLEPQIGHHVLRGRYNLNSCDTLYLWDRKNLKENHS